MPPRTMPGRRAVLVSARAAVPFPAIGAEAARPGRCHRRGFRRRTGGFCRLTAIARAWGTMPRREEGHRTGRTSLGGHSAYFER